MIVMIVFGIFGVVLLVVICCVLWLMIMICFEFCDCDKMSELLEEMVQKSVEGKMFFILSVFCYFLVSDGLVDFIELVVQWLNRIFQEKIG